ncbi:MAG: nucleotidyltransferase domain-containing protein [Candidatus Nanoarchaeia archaeon]|nr:nucleotidyltransferase domain-containing protein [Candidatus Nanoarchaeia archaeon]
MYLKRNDELKILCLYLGDYKRQFYLREISRLSKLPLKNTQNLLSILEKKNILKSVYRGKNKYFSLNLENIQTKIYLLQSEIYKTILFLEKYPQLKTFLKEVSETTIIVFGSFAKLAAEKNSDLDLLMIAEKEEKLPIYLIPYKIHEIRMSEKSFVKGLEKGETLIKEIEENHILLNNHSFYINNMWRQYAK